MVTTIILSMMAGASIGVLVMAIFAAGTEKKHNIEAHDIVRDVAKCGCENCPNRINAEEWLINAYFRGDV